MIVIINSDLIVKLRLDYKYIKTPRYRNGPMA